MIILFVHNVYRQKSETRLKNEIFYLDIHQCYTLQFPMLFQHSQFHISQEQDCRMTLHVIVFLHHIWRHTQTMLTN